MEIFINEVSLEGQYLSNVEFAKAIQQFISLLTVVNRMIKNSSVYKDSQTFLNYQAIKEQNFQQSLNNLRDKSQKIAFKNILFNKLNPIEWRKIRVSNESDNFDCVMIDKSYKDVKDTTLAEVTERQLQNQTQIYLVINFIQSSFNCPHIDILDCCKITVIKNNDEINVIELDSVDNKIGLENWIQVKLSLYENNSTYPPRDEQTILVNQTRFRKTQQRYDGRSIYLEVETQRYWYVDNFHYGLAAHLEVFDIQGNHLGEADITGNLDISKQDSNKHLNL
jgi:hypothetical protein